SGFIGIAYSSAVISFIRPLPVSFLEGYQATSLGLLLRMAEPCGQRTLSVNADIVDLKAD
ncbi:hypothetical protein, partial [Pseudomonas syringae]|uniref:hypothetical protein n=1 Tax=Pseudomonas syringae TaxID=317 RepID=UPI00217E1F7E